ncbi:MAG: HD domain-containing protein [Patescibacteria group bacterium]
MKSKYKKIWDEAQKYLRKGLNKDFVIHTEGVIKATELILKNEKGCAELLIPSAILHDVGWADVPKNCQRTMDKKMKLRGMKLHIELAPRIINNILCSLGYKSADIKKIIEIVQSHKFKKPKNLNKRILIDADQLSDAFKKQFYSDAKAYKLPPGKLLVFRMNDNVFYTKTAKNIFIKEIGMRGKEIENIK